MVSTRQMTIGGSGSGGSDGACSSSSDAAASRTTRQTLPVLPSVSSPPPIPQWAPGYSMTVVLKVTAPSTNLLDLPPEVLHKILSNLKFKNVSQLRMVNRQMNNVCGEYLNFSFSKLLGHMLQRYQTLKAKMPRRESARRNHPLACESDIIETLHMRLALLQMTFGKHIERKYCCFFPGEILDEVHSILEYLRVTAKLARPYKVTDELFDLSTMAMEYFKDHMEPNLPEITYFGTDFFDITAAFSPGDANRSYLSMDPPSPPGGGVAGCLSGGEGGAGGSGGGACLEEDRLPPTPPPTQSNMVLRKRIHRIKQGMKKYNNQLSALRSDLRSCKRKSAWQQKQIAEQQRQLAEQQKQTLDYSSRLDENDKKNEETSRKFQTLLQELNKCRTELQYWRSRSPAVAQPGCSECGLSTPPPPPPPCLMHHLSLEQDVGEADLWGTSTVVENPAPLESASTTMAVATAAPIPAASTSSSIPVLESPLSPKPVASGSKAPGSPKARRFTHGEKGHSSDEGAPKRALSEGVSSPQEQKKRRLHRTMKSRKL